MGGGPGTPVVSGGPSVVWRTMPTDLPGLSALLSQALVAFTIEFDNEFEHRMPHRTSATGRAGAPADALRAALQPVTAGLGDVLPDYLPVVGYGLFTEAPPAKPTAPPPSAAERGAERRDLSVLLAQALGAFTVEFERESSVSLAVVANTLRVLAADGTRVRDLPRLTGISKEAHAMALGFLESRGYVALEPAPAPSRGRIVRLTERGDDARDTARGLLGDVETRWRTRFGRSCVDSLRAALQRLAGGPDDQSPPLFGGLRPYPDGWRAALPAPTLLPYHPAVLHRGGFPDGS